ncbi:MAG: helix-turn-helix domain-containing protein [Anaerovibrio sp.]|uniref:helix-turn-helix domain-containing protein n=1 Tax=Anaerovibrio sp. TaxID=1872532 RepID=UPI0025F539CD|nr:helix-turn-helix transcriptional regulator [Anaerovibrio sp.]MCR5177202.1 helix-turn-helix domain-containing protein [Anaerovibrio sp.]
MNKLFVENLKRLCKEKDISGKELSTKTGMTEVTLSRYKTGKREPKISVVAKFAEALGVNVDEFLKPILLPMELLPCCKCGEIPVIRQTKIPKEKYKTVEDSLMYRIQCLKCLRTTSYHPTIEESVNSWNNLIVGTNMQMTKQQEGE